MKKLLLTAALTTSLATLSSVAMAEAISKKEVIQAQKEWANGIVEISKVFLDEGNYKERATKHINDLYAYESGTVLFKPTLASDDPFSGTFD